MSRILHIFEPTILPIAASGRPSKFSLKQTANSGALVPSATTVRPMTNGETPTFRASFELPPTNHSAPKYRPIIPSNK